MKKLFIFPLFLLVFCTESCIVSPRSNMSFVNENDDQNARFTSVNVPLWLAKPYIRKALREDGESEQVIELIRKIKKIKILSIENGNEKLVSNFTSRLSTDNFQDFVTLRHEGQNVDIKAKMDGDLIKNLMLCVKSDKELIFIDVAGAFSTDDISRLINESEKISSKKRLY